MGKLFSSIDEKPCFGAYRVGKSKLGLATRPVKVTGSSPMVVNQILYT